MYLANIAKEAALNGFLNMSKDEGDDYRAFDSKNPYICTLSIMRAASISSIQVGRSLLSTARSGKVASVNFWWNLGLVNSKTEDGQNALMRACISGNLELVKYFIS
jgi:hypothetical protein